ncbi:hypothetical protein DMP17_29495 [Pseudonocardia sp. TMWB2A]|uniref:formyltransferase family protein n=1 Tax=Pseudonocardia sp. TMWB2A TaxID=687430 RepID=UPI00307CF4E2
MIFVGSGALLWRAATYATQVGRTVDAVVHPRGEEVPPQAASLNCVDVRDVNEHADLFRDSCGDGLVCSTGNPFIFREPVLSLGLTIVNVHGAPLPQYRGLPLATAAFAILRSEREFGVTLHRVDAGIDTGPIIDRRMFPLSRSATLEELSIEVTQHCHAILTANLDDLGRAPASEVSSDPADAGEYFGARQLASLENYRDHPNFARATDLGVLDEYYPSFADLFSTMRGHLG